MNQFRRKFEWNYMFLNGVLLSGVPASVGRVIIDGHVVVKDHKQKQGNAKNVGEDG